MEPVLKDSKELIDTASFFVNFLEILLLTPMFLVFFVSVIIVVLVFCSYSGKCSGSEIRTCSSILFAPTILAVALASTCEMWMGIATGSFCINAEANELALAQHSYGTASVEYQLGLYYFAQNSTNPLLENLDQAAMYVNRVNSTLAAVQQLIYLNCGTRVNKLVTGLQADFTVANTTITFADNLLSQQHISPYYQAVVPEGVCQKLVSGVGWLIVFQLITGLLCLPWLAAAAIRFQRRQSQYARGGQSRPLQFREAQMSRGFGFRSQV